MKPLHNNPYSAHQEISLLLPWYVNKTLHGAEIERVENHLKVCLICRRELVTLQKLAAAVQQEGSFDSAAIASFSRLKKRIHNVNQVSPEKVSKAVVLPERRQWYGKRLFLPRPAFALAAVLLFSLLLPRFIDTGNIQMNDYRTLSNAENPATGSQNTISIIFLNGTEQRQINETLTSVHGHIINGPTAQGVYTVTVAGKLAPKEVLDLVAALRKNPNVIFAEPAYALLSSAHADKDTK